MATITVQQEAPDGLAYRAGAIIPVAGGTTVGGINFGPWTTILTVDNFSVQTDSAGSAATVTVDGVAEGIALSVHNHTTTPARVKGRLVQA